MTIELGPSPTPEQVRKYTVPAEYRNRNDAKLAVVLRAVEQGAIEFLRFRGNPPPPGYVPYFAQQDHQFLNRNGRRVLGWQRSRCQHHVRDPRHSSKQTWKLRVQEHAVSVRYTERYRL